MFGLGTMELMIIGILAILLFGKNLPDVARKFGKHYREFRRGLSDLQSTVNLNDVMNEAPTRSSPPKRSYSDYDDYDDVSAPKFEPPPAPPTAANAANQQDAA